MKMKLGLGKKEENEMYKEKVCDKRRRIERKWKRENENERKKNNWKI